MQPRQRLQGNSSQPRLHPGWETLVGVGKKRGQQKRKSTQKSMLPHHNRLIRTVKEVFLKRGPRPKIRNGGSEQLQNRKTLGVETQNRPESMRFWQLPEYYSRYTRVQPRPSPAGPSTASRFQILVLAPVLLSLFVQPKMAFTKYGSAAAAACCV